MSDYQANLDYSKANGFLIETHHCGNPQCECHTDPKKRVMTPFPSRGAEYCCSKCAMIGGKPKGE